MKRKYTLHEYVSLCNPEQKDISIEQADKLKKKPGKWLLRKE